MADAEAIKKEYAQYVQKNGVKKSFFGFIKYKYEEKKRLEQEAKEKAEREYAAKQATVDTDVLESSNGNLTKDKLKIKGRSRSSGRNLV